MEAAKQFVAQFTSKKGHKTYVEETVRPAVTIETIKPTRHEIVTEAVNKEVHQHHYHTTVQPLSHKEVLPTKHTHNPLTTIHRDYAHKTKDINLKVQDTHQKELALFTNTSNTLPTTHTVAALPAVVAEHVHHHVHEIVQPIVFKEVVTPEVVHTTIPIHEVHHQEPIHHGMSELSAIAMADFMARSKRGQSVARQHYDGEPRAYNSKFKADVDKVLHKPTPIITTPAKRNTMTTPPLSPASASSSPLMPSTPKHHSTAEPGFRTSEDSMHDFSLMHSPTTKTVTKTPNSTTTTTTNTTVNGPRRIRI